MRKVLSIIAAGLATLTVFSCAKEEDKIIFDPSDVVAPVVNDYEITDNALAVHYTAAQFAEGIQKAVHGIVLTNVDGKAVETELAASEKEEGILSVSKSALNKALAAEGMEEGAVCSFSFIVRATLAVANFVIDSKNTGDVSGYELPATPSNPWIDFKDVSAWGVTGSIASAGLNWDKDIVMYTDGGRHVARNVKLTPSDQFKFRKDHAWGENFGGEGDVEPFVCELGTEYVAVAGGKNLGVAAEGVYDLLLDTDAGTFTVLEAFVTYPGFDEDSPWSVIGAIESFEMNWDKDIAMTTNGEWHVAEGVELKATDQFKFRKDQAWGENFGAEGDVEPFICELDTEYPASAGGKNLAVAVDGAYDLLVNPEAKLFKVVETLGGKSGLIGGSDDPGPEPPAVTGWNIIGLNGDWDNDVIATQNGSVWSAYITANGETDFKWRKDGGWDENYGGTLLTLGEPFDAVAGGDNIKVGAGFYKVELDTEALTITVSEGNVYSLIGEINGDAWSKDVFMTEKDGVWSSVTVAIEGGFKIRHNCSWADENVYGAEDGFTAEPGVAFTAVQPGGNISVAPGQYKVTFNPETKEVLIGESKYPEHLYMIGEEFGSWNWDSDDVVEMTPVIYQPDWGAGSNNSEAQFWTIRYISAGKGFKFSPERAWGKDFWGLTSNDGFTEAGGNCTVAEDGIYLIHVDMKNEKVHVEPARVYGIGNCFGGWNEAMEGALFTADGKTLKATVAAAGELRMYVASSISTSEWWTREFIILDGMIDYRGDDEGQGDQARVSVQAGQVVTLDFNAGTGSITGEGEAPTLPETMYIIGDGVGGWDWAGDYIVDMTPVNGKPGQFWAIRSIEAGKGFKFCAVKEWNNDFTGLGEDTGYTVDGGNCYVAESGVYMIYVDVDNKRLCVEPAQVYGIGECFGGWDQGMDNALFAAADGKLSVTVPNAGELRIYAASSIATSDWWTREFIILDGKIAYRGNGDDQERVSVAAGAKVTLDFNAGTGVIE